jgi:aminotransferase
VFTKAELKKFAAIAHKHDLVILSDEIWSDIVYDPHKYTSISSLDEETHNRTITVTGFSKSYGLAGLRIGTLEAGTKAYFDRLLEASLHTSTIHGANTIGQVAAATAMTQCQPWLQQFVAHLTRMRDLCVAGLNDIQGVTCKAPEGCYVAFADIRGTGSTSKEIADFFMQEKKVAVVPGLRQWFGDGAEGYIRLSFATSEAILGEALARLKK